MHGREVHIRRTVGKRPPARSVCRWRRNIIIHIKEVGFSLSGFI